MSDELKHALVTACVPIEALFLSGSHQNLHPDLRDAFLEARDAIRAELPDEFFLRLDALASLLKPPQQPSFWRAFWRAFLGAWGHPIENTTNLWRRYVRAK